jgi:hypothetical protein
MAVKVPPMLHKMSVAAQKAWYKKNKMEYPGAVGKEGRSAAQAKKDVGEINKKKAREAAIAAAAKASKKNKALVSSSERVREMGRRRRESGEGLGGGLETNRDILSYVRAGGIIKAGRLGEEVAKKEEPPFTPDKKVVRRGPGGPMSQAKWLAKQAMMKKIKSMKDVKEETKKYTDMSPEEKWKDARAEKDPVKKNAKLGALAMGGGGNITPKKPSLIPNSPRRFAADPKKYTQKADGQWVREEVEVVEAVKDVADIGEYDYEGDMAKSQLRSILANAKRMHDMLEDNTNLPEWVQSKITLAQDYVQTAASYMESEMNEEVSIDEKMNLATAKMGDVIKDFQKSDAPQFKGKSKEKKREMAIAAKLEAERGEMKEEAEPVEEKYMGFKKLAASIKAKGGARDPEAVAAAIGRKKYGKEKFQAAAAAGKKMSEAALDPVGKEDKDIDNDGDSDKTDVYLSKRRKAIGSAIRKKVADKMGK